MKLNCLADWITERHRFNRPIAGKIDEYIIPVAALPVFTISAAGDSDRNFEELLGSTIPSYGLSAATGWLRQRLLLAI